MAFYSHILSLSQWQQKITRGHLRICEYQRVFFLLPEAKTRKSQWIVEKGLRNTSWSKRLCKREDAKYGALEKLTLDNTRSQAKPSQKRVKERVRMGSGTVFGPKCHLWIVIHARTGTKNPESPRVYLVPVLLFCAFLSQVKKGQRTVEEGLRNGSLSKRPCLNRD